MPSRRAFVQVLALATLAAAFAPALPAAAESSSKLFFIQRSKNADEVHYDARLKSDGTLDESDPVNSYWLNKHPGGPDTRSPVTLLQRIAYGYSTTSTGNGTFALKLKAFSERPMWIVKAGGRYRLQTTIAGKQAFMNRLYVATDESGVMPTVLYVDVFGDDAATGSPLTEHIVKH